MAANEPMPTNDHNPTMTSLFDLSGRTAVVVGAGSGLGQASAIGLADAGAHVIAADLNLAGAEETAALIAARDAGSAAALAVDITDTESVESLVAAHADARILVVTPGANVRKRLTTTTDDEFDRVIDINLKGTYRLMRGFGREMAQRGRGAIVTATDAGARAFRTVAATHGATIADRMSTLDDEELATLLRLTQKLRGK